MLNLLCLHIAKNIEKRINHLPTNNNSHSIRMKSDANIIASNICIRRKTQRERDRGDFQILIYPTEYIHLYISISFAFVCLIPYTTVGCKINGNNGC